MAETRQAGRERAEFWRHRSCRGWIFGQEWSLCVAGQVGHKPGRFFTSSVWWALWVHTHTTIAISYGASNCAVYWPAQALQPPIIPPANASLSANVAINGYPSLGQGPVQKVPWCHTFVHIPREMRYLVQVVFDSRGAVVLQLHVFQHAKS